MPIYPLGYPIDSNRRIDTDLVALPENRLCRHCCITGGSGSGKSTLLQRIIYSVHHRTDGAEVFIDPKGDGMPKEVCQSKYVADGTLDDVYLFRADQIVPALSFFDLRPQLAAGLSRHQAVEDIADHYLELARAVRGAEQFDQAGTAPDIIRALVVALFDPEFGADAYSHGDLEEAALRLQQEGEPPAVSDVYETARRELESVAAMTSDMRHAVMSAVRSRLSSVSTRPQLRAMLNHVPPETTTDTADGDETATADHPTFDLYELLNEDALIILDISWLRGEAQRLFTLVVLSKLWSALRRRKRMAKTNAPPIVNLFLEEAGAFKNSDLLEDLVREGRSFRVSVTLLAQQPKQLATENYTADAKDEVLNNVGTIVSGRVPNDPDLAKRFATPEMDAEEAQTRLSGLAGGRWILSLSGHYEEQPPRPFRIASPSPPPGHPASGYPLAESRLATQFKAAFDERQTTVVETAGRSLETLYTASETNRDGKTTATADAQQSVALKRANLLPRTRRLPDCVVYQQTRHQLACRSCETTYRPTFDGLLRTIECCHRLGDIDRDNIPVIDCYPNLDAEAVTASDLTAGQVCIMQAIHDATHQRHHPLAFDLVTDSMVLLREYTGVDHEAVVALRERGLITRDTNQTPHRVYSLTPAGREQLDITLTEGREYGDGVGDLSESALHRLAVELSRRYLYQEFVLDDASPVTEAVDYHAVGDGKRLDAAGLDADGEVVVALEAERVNNDRKEAVPADYDTMAACDPDHAIWVVMNRDGGHTVLEALNEPAEGPPRVETTYGGSTPPHQFRLDAPGCTAMYTVSRLATIVDDHIHTEHR